MKISRILAIASILIITLIFVATLSPAKGFGIITFPLLMIGILIWVASLIFFLIGFFNKTRDKNQKRSVILSIILIAGIIPLSIIYTATVQYVKTKITVSITNRSDYIPVNILVYGTGNIFNNPDTLKLDKLNKEGIIKFSIWPSTRPFGTGFIKMDYDIGENHISKNIAGEFSINPYMIQQHWEVIFDNGFMK